MPDRQAYRQKSVSDRTSRGVVVENKWENHVHLCSSPAQLDLKAHGDGSLALESGACDHCEPAAPRGSRSFTVEM